MMQKNHKLKIILLQHYWHIKKVILDNPVAAIDSTIVIAGSQIGQVGNFPLTSGWKEKFISLLVTRLVIGNVSGSD